MKQLIIDGIPMYGLHTVIPGVAFRTEAGEVQTNPRRDRIKNVDEIPWPAWEYFDVEAYSSNRLVSGIYYGKTVPILATRGCPYQCTYCSSPGMWTTRWYARTPQQVADEIATLEAGGQDLLDVDPLLGVFRDVGLESRGEAENDQPEKGRQRP